MRFRLVPTLIAAVAFVVLVGLGTWQMQRLEWKTALIAERDNALAAPPVALQKVASDPEAFRFRRVKAEGVYRHDSEVLIAPRTFKGQSGRDVITPMTLSDGRILLVNRGWIPEDRVDPALRAQGQIVGNVSVTGIVSQAGKSSTWTPDNEPASNSWYFVDIDAISKARGLSAAPLPFVFRADATPNPGGLPRGRPARFELKNDHLEYALTWYALAFVLAVIYFLSQRRRRTENS